MALAEWEDVRRQPADADLLHMQNATLRAAAALTDSYRDTEWLNASAFAELSFGFNITKASLTSFEFKLYWSDDEVNWESVISELVTPGSTILTVQEYTTQASESFRWTCVVKGQFVKLQVKGTGTVAGSSLGITVTGRY